MERNNKSNGASNINFLIFNNKGLFLFGASSAILLEIIMGERKPLILVLAGKLFGLFDNDEQNLLIKNLSSLLMMEPNARNLQDIPLDKAELIHDKGINNPKLINTLNIIVHVDVGLSTDQQ